jgi:gas vesicle protein
MSSGKLLLGVLAGVAAGAALGILFAPEKGADTRKRMVKKGNDYADDLKDKFDEFLCSITEKLDNVKSETNTAFENGKTKVQDFKVK